MDVSSITNSFGPLLSGLAGAVPIILVMIFVAGFFFVILNRKRLARTIPVLREYRHTAVIFPRRGGEYLPELISPVAVVYEEDGSEKMHIQKLDRLIERINNKYISRSNLFGLFTADFKEFYPTKCEISKIDQEITVIPVMGDEELQHYANTTRKIRAKYANPSFFEKYQGLIAALIVGVLCIGIIAVNNSTVAEAQVRTAEASSQIADSLNAMTNTLIAGGILHKSPAPVEQPKDEEQKEPGA